MSKKINYGIEKNLTIIISKFCYEKILNENEMLAFLQYTGSATLWLGVRSVSMSNEFSGEISFWFCAPSWKTSDFDQGSYADWALSQKSSRKSHSWLSGHTEKTKLPLDLVRNDNSFDSYNG